jgi:hypothetical protein
LKQSLFSERKGFMKKMSLKRISLRMVLVLCLLSLPYSLCAQLRAGVGGWQHLGSAHVDGRADHDRIEVGGGPFRSLELGVTDGAIGFERVVVHFRNGQEEILPVGVVVRSGGRTPAIPMRGGPREISNVEIWYQKGAISQGKPRVDLFGRR